MELSLKQPDGSGTVFQRLGISESRAIELSDKLGTIQISEGDSKVDTWKHIASICDNLEELVMCMAAFSAYTESQYPTR